MDQEMSAPRSRAPWPSCDVVGPSVAYSSRSL